MYSPPAVARPPRPHRRGVSAAHDAPAPARWTRAGLFAGVCLGLSAAGHTAVAGHDVSVPGLLLGGGGAMALAWALSARQRGFGTILGWLLWAQVALHLLFQMTWTGGDTAGAGTAGSHDAADLAASDPVAGAGWMLLFHLLAAVVSACWLWQGESAAFALVRLVASLLVAPLLRLLRPLPEIPTPRPAPVVAAPPRPRPRPHGRAAAPRAPPRLLRSP